MRKLALVVFLLTNLGGVAMAAPFMDPRPAPSFAPSYTPSFAPSYTPSYTQHVDPRPAPSITPRQTPRTTPHETPRITEQQRRDYVRRGVTVVCNDAGYVELYIDAFARVPQLDGSTKDFPIALTAADTAAGADINQALMRGFEQALNQESARQGRTVDALLAHGAALGNRDENQHVALYTFNLDAELHIVREAYLLRTQPTRA